MLSAAQKAIVFLMPSSFCTSELRRRRGWAAGALQSGGLDFLPLDSVLLSN